MKKLNLLGLLTCITLLSMSAPAQADDAFGITASQTAMVSAGQTISIKVNNLPADQGIYIRQCVLVSGIPDTTQCTKLQSNPASVLWVTNLAASQAQGGANPANLQAFTLVGQIGTTSCIATTCGLVTARDHLAFSDRSLDTATPLVFSTLTPAVNKVANFADAGDSVTVTLTGLGENQGVYVRECAIGALPARPQLCNGMGVWASNSASSVTMGATSAANPVTLALRGIFTAGQTSVDCQVTACGIFIRLDHTASGDSSADTVIPITFATPVAIAQQAGRWIKATGLHTVKLGTQLSLAYATTKTKQGGVLTWKSQTPTTCSVSKLSTKMMVKFNKVGRCTVVASAKASSRLKSAGFTWSFSVKR